MNKKIMSRVFFIIAVVSLVTGASFHGYRIHPEDAAKYNIGVTMGIVMISIFMVSLIAGIVMTILVRKEEKPVPVIEYDPEKQRAVLKCSICNGEQMAGFKDKQTGHFTEVMLIKDGQDLNRFMQMYDLSAVNKEY